MGVVVKGYGQSRATIERRFSGLAAASRATAARAAAGRGSSSWNTRSSVVRRGRADGSPRRMLQSKASIENREYKAQRALLADVDSGKISKPYLFAHAELMLKERMPAAADAAETAAIN